MWDGQLGKSIQPPIESSNPLEKPYQFIPYRTALFQKRKTLRKKKFINVGDEIHRNRTIIVSSADRFRPNEGRNPTVSSGLSQTKSSNHQVFIALTTDG